MKHAFMLTTLALAVAALTLTARAQQNFTSDFVSSANLPAGWTGDGKVTVDATTAFKGRRAVRLERAPEAAEQPCALTGPAFALAPGTWELALACKCDLESPDNSFDGVAGVELLDAAGAVTATVKLADVWGQSNWQRFSRRVETPATAVAARFFARVNKASGQFWVDEMTATFIAAAGKKASPIDRIVFDTAQMGNLLFPEDARTVTVTVVANQPLPADRRELNWVLRDYWGAECGVAGAAALGTEQARGDKFAYAAAIDLGAAPLAAGRYYELHAELTPAEGAEPFRNHTSLAILPPPITKRYKPEEIPFSSRNWDGRVPDFFHLADRCGVRITGLWSSWDVEPPYTPHAPTIEVAQKLGMGIISGTPCGIVEHRRPGWEKVTDAALRAGVRRWIETYGRQRPLLFTLGNEPPVIAERLPANVAAYKAVYEEIKKIDPGIIVIATSVGPVEEYFKAGFHHYCDVVDFHVYGDWQEIPLVFKEYDRLFAKYGDRKPIWSTEIGLNSHGLPRQTVARTLIKKVTSFFACGGGNMCWFDFGYPDPDAKIADDPTSAHNVFDCRYAPRYCPKLDAIAYYNMINGIAVKKFAAQKVYGDDAHAFLFRDRDGHCLQVIWKEKGRLDAFVALPGVRAVTAIAIDGRRAALDAGGKGLTLTIDEDPLLLLYDSAAASLAETLEPPAARFAALPESVVKGGAVTLALAEAAAAELSAPASWPVQKTGDAAWRLTAPENTAAREGDVIVKLADGKGGCNGELRARITVAGRMAARLLPVAAGATGQAPGVRLILQNNAEARQELRWRLTLTGAFPMERGRYDMLAPVAPTAYFADNAEGVATLDAQSSAEIVVPLAGVDRQTIYRLKAVVADPSGRVIECERHMAGFVRVPRAKSKIKLDGAMAEPDWRDAPVEHLNEARQFYSFRADKAWQGAAGLSGELRFLWDNEYLYLGVTVRDDVFVNNKVGGDIWAGDGLQMMVDPARDRPVKVGKYDLAMALTKNGPQAWCYLAADGGAPAGEANDIVVAAKRLDPARGDMNYTVAIPWSRIAPFQPAPGANLGLCVAINDDDGPGRDCHMNWFADIESKQVDTVGDLILAP